MLRVNFIILSWVMVSLLVAKITILSLMVKDMNYTILTRISLLKLPQVPFAIPK